MSTSTAYCVLPGIAGARVIFTLLGLAAIASLLLGTCANRFTHQPPVSLRAALVAPAQDSDARTGMVRAIEQMGLNPQVQSAPGGIHNIVARKYGSASDRAVRPALLISADRTHAPAISAALRGAAPLASDLIFLFADGPPGRAVFARHHPWAQDAGVVLRFEGSGPKLLLTEARCAGIGQLQDWMARTSSSLGSSALHTLPQHGGQLRHYDISDWKCRNVAADPMLLTFAGAAAPENPGAPRAILALVRHFADTPQDAVAPEPVVHFWLPLAGQVAYDAALVASASRVAALALLLACCVAWRHAGLRLHQLAAAALCNLLLAALLTAAGMAAVQPVIMGAAGAVLFLALHRLLLVRAGAHATVLGTLLALMPVLAAATLAWPGVSYLLIWPLLAVLAAYAGAQLPLSPPVRLALAAVAAATALALFLPLLAQLAPARSPAFMPAVSVLLAFGSALAAALKLGSDFEAGVPLAP